jgi:site-specific DNA recombinase
MKDKSKSNSREAAPAVIYVRVSPGRGQAAKGGEPDGYSIPAQQTACRRKAASLKAAVVEEFIERSESAKTADRPELQRLLEYVKAHAVKYVIVHKVDRLARNRADDVAINLALQQAGARLVSVSENIDQTPSGLLLHGIMSSIAEFYSRNLATEVIKGCVQKAKNGGTPGRVPLGYLNVRRMVEGLESRTVDVDPQRGPLMAWAFEAYASGDWTIRSLLAELTERGLTTAPGPKTISKPLSDSQLHKLLRHPYYMGVVRYQGVLYAGKHTQLVTPQTWQQVQDLLSAKNLAGEKQREHPHYLKGSIYCGQCGSRLIVNHAKGNGGTYRYFVCIGRQKDKASCSLRAIRIDHAEAAIAEHYASVQLPAEEVARLQTFLSSELSKLRADAEHERKAQERRKRSLEAERQKLLTAHYADAIPLDLLKTEQARITAGITAIEGRLAAVAADFRKAEANLQRALARAGDCQAAYREAAGRLRRQFNLAFFKRLLIGDDYTVTGELTEPFDLILSDDLRLAAAIQAEEDARAVELAQRLPANQIEIQNEQRPPEPERVLVGVGPPTPTLSQVMGWSVSNMVELVGLEPTTFWLPARRSSN